MPPLSTSQRPIYLAGVGKTEVRSQFGALPWRLRDGKIEVLLVTSRGRGRWILPKGWPVHGATPGEAAATEAWEEAGVEGDTAASPVGFYAYRKEIEGGELPIVVAIFPVRVRKLHDNWPEKGQRKRQWMGRKKAARLLDDPTLAKIVRAFDPREQRR